MLGLHCCEGFSLVVASEGYSFLVVMCRLALRWLLLLWSKGSRVCRFQEAWFLGSRVQAQ